MFRCRDHSEGQLLPDDNEETSRGTSAWSNACDALGDPSAAEEERNAHVRLNATEKAQNQDVKRELAAATGRRRPTDIICLDFAYSVA